MSFFSKLFGIKKKKESLVTKGQLKEETRVISMNSSSENEVRILEEKVPHVTYGKSVANNVVSKLLVQAIENKEVKEYANLKKFIKNYPPIKGEVDYEHPVPKTEELEKLAKSWYQLSYKCNNENLNKLMSSLR